MLQGISQRGKLLMMLGQCVEAASDFQRVVEYVFYIYWTCGSEYTLTVTPPGYRLFPTDATAAQSLEKSTQCAAYIDEAGKAQVRSC